MDLEASLPEAVKLSVGSWTHYQKLDYEHLQFKCRNCQEHGHFQRHCPKLTEEKEDAEGWQKVKKGKNPNSTKSKEKVTQEPPKGDISKSSSQGRDNEIQIPTSAPEKEEVRAYQGPNSSTPHTAIPSPSKEPISLGSETGAESSEEGDTEVSSPSGTPNQPKRGRKSERKRREEQSYKDVVQGSQHTIPEMMNTRSRVKIGKTPKGPPPLT